MNQLISIIIPAYNLEKYVERTITNVLSQNYPHFEIIVVNDGSKDSTGAILDRLAAAHPDKLRVIHIPNGGVTNARLTGLRHAKGNWIAFVDGDDLVEPNIYTTLMKNALETNADISHCGYFMEFPSRVVPYHGSGKKEIHNTEEGLLQLLTGTLVEPGLWNKLYKRELVEKFLLNSAMDPSIKNNEDLLMNFYLFREATSSIFEDVCLYRYMVRAGSAANSALNEHLLLDPSKVRKIIMDHCKDLPGVYPIACKEYVHHLIKISTRTKKNTPLSLFPHVKNSRNALRHAMNKNLPLPCSLRLTAWWAIISPGSYSLVHKLYSKLRGYDKLYEIS